MGGRGVVMSSSHDVPAGRTTYVATALVLLALALLVSCSRAALPPDVPPREFRGSVQLTNHP